MNAQLISGAECADMLEIHSNTVWPEFILHDPWGEKYWEALFEKFPGFQFALTDGKKIIGTGNSIPLSMDIENIDFNEGGWDWALEKGFTDQQQGLRPTVLCGLQIGINEEYRGMGMSALFIEAMRNIALREGFKRLILPIRPTQKSKYPLTDIEDYIHWKTPQGLPYDPWIRAHIKYGAEIVSVCHRAMYIPGSIKEWEKWTGLSIQSPGEYILSGGLVPLQADLKNDKAEYIEPNVWMMHRL